VKAVTRDTGGEDCASGLKHGIAAPSTAPSPSDSCAFPAVSCTEGLFNLRSVRKANDGQRGAAFWESSRHGLSRSVREHVILERGKWSGGRNCHFPGRSSDWDEVEKSPAMMFIPSAALRLVRFVSLRAGGLLGMHVMVQK
jgi:hypothetical protein